MKLNLAMRQLQLMPRQDWILQGSARRWPMPFAVAFWSVLSLVFWSALFGTLRWL